MLNVSVSRKALAIVTAFLAGSLGILLAAGSLSILSRVSSVAQRVESWTIVVIGPLGFVLGILLWSVIVRRLDLFSWDEIDEIFGVDKDIDESGRASIAALIVAAGVVLIASLVASSP